jgi:hypothetical protein
MKSVRDGMSLLLLAFIAALGLVAQNNTSEITGVIYAPGREPLHGATLTATDLARGISRSITSGPDGDYALKLLRPGHYQLTYAAQGYETIILNDVELQIGEVRRQDVDFNAETAKLSVTVTSEAPAVEPERIQQSTTISSAVVENLPINLRTYLSFALLAPGVVDSTTVTDANDYRNPATPNSGLAIGGDNGRTNQFSVDGIENYGVAGNFRPSVSQTAVQEFIVARNSYAADLGNAGGGTLDIVTKSGTNEFHGSLFGYLRATAFQARNYFDPGKQSYTRLQSGASVGGPISKDRTFFFFAVEGEVRHQAALVTIADDPASLSSLTPSQQSLVNFLNISGVPQLQQVGAILSATLNPSSNPAVVALFRQNSGVFPFSENVAQPSLRLDHRFSDRNLFFTRANYTFQDAANPQLTALTGYSRASVNRVVDLTGMASDTFLISPSLTNVARAAYAYDRFALDPNDAIGPAIDIGGFGAFGRNTDYPYSRREQHFTVGDQLLGTHGAHHWRLGAEMNGVHLKAISYAYFGGDAIFGSFLPLGAFLDSATGVNGFSAGLAQSLTALGQPGLASSLAQPLTALQTYALGIPLAWLGGYGDPSYRAWQRRFGTFADDTWRITKNLTFNAGLRLQVENNPIIGTLANLSPRAGFAWAPGLKTVIRGGFGLYHSTIDAQIPYAAGVFSDSSLVLFLVPVTGYPGLAGPSGIPTTSVSIYQTLAAEGVLGKTPITLANYAQFGIKPGFSYPVTGGIDPTYVAPYSEQASFEIERSLGSTSFSAAWNFVRGAHLPRELNRNLVQLGTQPDGLPIIGYVNPNIAQNIVFESTANSYYHALILQANRRLLHGWSLQAHYTFSKAIDEVSDWNADYMPQNQFRPREDRGLSQFNQKHRAVVAALYESPSHNVWLRNWTTSLIFTANSGRPFNILTGTDNFGDGNVTTHRPIGAGRDIGKGPAFVDADLRITRFIHLSHDSRYGLSLIAECFNTLNHTNFATVNNIVGDVPLSSLPANLTGQRTSPSTPLAFTSAFDPRQFQFAVKFSF